MPSPIMEYYLIGAVILGVIILSILGAKYWPKTIAQRELYDGSITKPQCDGAFPPAPTNIPSNAWVSYDAASAYALANEPRILSSASNPKTNPTLHPSPRGGYSYDFYSDQYVCNTPWELPAFNNDSCAQYGIGERAEGPEGHKFCVCETKRKDSSETVPKFSLTGKDVVIGVGAVCTSHGQCCTNHCGSVPGQFSKMCVCPPGSAWDVESSKCMGNYTAPLSAWSSMYDDHVEAYRPPPRGSIPSSGKLCASNADCGLGEACNPDNFCASQLISTTELDSNRFNRGANCEDDTQCASNMRCLPPPPGDAPNGMGRCQCPNPLIFDWLATEFSGHASTPLACQCADGSLTLSEGKCIHPSQVPRKFCPSTPPAFATGWQDCGLGERFVPGSNQCACVSDLTTVHPGKIGPGGKCDNSEQCMSGQCDKVSAINVCVEPQQPVWNMSVREYI